MQDCRVEMAALPASSLRYRSHHICERYVFFQHTPEEIHMKHSLRILALVFQGSVRAVQQLARTNKNRHEHHIKYRHHEPASKQASSFSASHELKGAETKRKRKPPREKGDPASPSKWVSRLRGLHTAH